MDQDAIRDVADGAAADAGGVDTGLLGDFLPIAVDAASSGRRLSRAELTRCGERGSAAALAGVPLRALIDLYLSACWRLWEQLPTVAHGDAQQVRDAGLAVLRAADDAVAALAEGFQLARNDLSRYQESARREVFDALLSGGPAAQAVAGRASGLGLQLTSPHAVLVVVHRASFDGPAMASVPRALERALAGSHGDANPLIAVKNGQLVCIFAAPDAASVTLATDRLTGVLDGASGDRTPGRWQAAAGSPLPGAAAVRVSYDQACEALELAHQLQWDTSVIKGADLAIYRVLLRDREAMEELITTVLGPLASARGGAAPLLETLAAYYSVGGVATEAAKRLHLSVRAVTYRLQRIRELVGQDPADPAVRLTLHAAVLGARLLDWPAGAPRQ